MPDTAYPPVRTVGVVAKPGLRAAIPHLVDIADWLLARGVNVLIDQETATLMPAAATTASAGSRGAASPSSSVVDKPTIAAKADLVLILGGDGTLLSMADHIGSAGSRTPILGVNFGSLGFLTEVTLPEIFPALETAITGQSPVEERMMLRAIVHRRGAEPAESPALNDVVITKTARARMIDLSVYVGDEFVTRVKADGLIIATPTGSTAYNLSAGGPIVHPSVDALVLTPIAPHTLTNRPVVIPSLSAVRVQPNMETRDEVFITFDGQAGFQLEAGDEVTVHRAERALRLIRPSTRSYFEVLRTKLKWGER